jgi:hypothetical protein
LHAPSDQRQNLVKKLGTNARMIKLKEDMGVLAYLRRNGLEKESLKYNSQQTLEEF